jgi:hypothetical protein
MIDAKLIKDLAEWAAGCADNGVEVRPFLEMRSGAAVMMLGLKFGSATDADGYDYAEVGFYVDSLEAEEKPLEFVQRHYDDGVREARKVIDARASKPTENTDG